MPSISRVEGGVIYRLDPPLSEHGFRERQWSFVLQMGDSKAAQDAAYAQWRDEVLPALRARAVTRYGVSWWQPSRAYWLPRPSFPTAPDPDDVQRWLADLLQSLT